VGAPKHPGTVGRTDNPGLPIRWNDIGITNPGTPNTDKLTLTDNCPTSVIGKYIFKDVAPGDYVIAIARLGFLTRYGLITVTDDDYLEHREILGGDVNGDRIIDEKDLSIIRSKTAAYGTRTYNAIYDMSGTKSVNSADMNVIRIDLEAPSAIYQETKDFVE